MAPHTQHIDPNGRPGLWPQTATIDWCESNYELSYFIAEFWNTLSNLAFIVPQVVQYSALSKYKSIEPAFNGAFLSLALVGIGSLCFHMTLLRPMQMFDETSMILVSLHGFYLLCIIRNPSANRRLLITGLLLYGLIFLTLYVFLVHRPIFHHTTFALLVYASIAIGYRLKSRYGGYYKFWTVVIIQHLGLVCWLIDKHYCEALTFFRENHVPKLLQPLFQFHAMWHLLMGLGSHIFICSLVRLRAWTKFRDEFAFRYRNLWIYLDKVSSSATSSTSSSESSKQQDAEWHQKKGHLCDDNLMNNLKNKTTKKSATTIRQYDKDSDQISSHIMYNKNVHI